MFISYQKSWWDFSILFVCIKVRDILVVGREKLFKCYLTHDIEWCNKQQDEFFVFFEQKFNDHLESLDFVKTKISVNENFSQESPSSWMRKNPIYSERNDVHWEWILTRVFLNIFFHTFREKLLVNILTGGGGHFDDCLTHFILRFQDHLFLHKLSLSW
mgnify:CR=1 FL=1